MGSGGTEWETNDNFDWIRLNKKTNFVGTGQQATNLITSPQIGQAVYSTESDATFIKDKFAFYDSSETWVCPHTAESSEQNSGDTSSAVAASGTNARTYVFFTLPTTEKFYIITGYTSKSRGTSGVITIGTDIVNANPPTLDSTPLVAVSREYTTSGVSDEEFTIREIASKPIRGGTVLGTWIATPTAGVGGLQTGSDGYWKSITYTANPLYSNNDAFTQAGSVGEAGVKTLYVGYS